MLEPKERSRNPLSKVSKVEGDTRHSDCEVTKEKYCMVVFNLMLSALVIIFSKLHCNPLCFHTEFRCEEKIEGTLIMIYLKTEIFAYVDFL